MSTMSKAIASNTTADVYVFNNTRYILQEEPMPSWARDLLESLQALDIKFDQHDIRLKNLESLDKSNSWEDNSPQIEIPKESINDPPNFSNFVPSNDQYLRDMTDYQYNEVRVDIPLFKEVDDPKEYLNEDMTSSLPKTTDGSFSCNVKHKDDGQKKFIKPNSQRQDIIIKYWVSIRSIHREQG